MDKRIKWLVASIIVGVTLLVLTFLAVKISTVDGNEIGVKETWSDGVVENPLQSKTYWLIPGWSQKIYTYDLSSRVFTMNDTPTKIEHKYKGREADSYHVQSSDNQDMKISLNVRWRIDPDKIVQIHKTIRTDIEEKLIRPTVMLVVKNEATERKAIEAFSGDGLVKLQMAIQKELCNPNAELRQRGIIVENFVIEKIELDDKYVGEIRARQVAMMAKSRIDEETKAAQASALKSKAEAEADYNKRVVEAERDKKVGILKAEEMAQKQILAAESEKRQTVLRAEGEKESGVLRAQAIEAVGKAETDVTKLKLSAYAVPGAEAFVRVEVAKHMAEAYGNIKGYLPADMKVNLLTESFLKSVDSLMGKIPGSVPAKKE